MSSDIIPSMIKEPSAKMGDTKNKLMSLIECKIQGDLIKNIEEKKPD